MPALLVISAGFAEAGEEGAERQRELVEVCRDAGMRLIGPNCMGVLNTDPDVSLNATFAPSPATPGGVAFLSQSGGLGIAIIEAADRLGVGLSSFVSVGNKADLSSNDLLQYWEEDPNTDVALLYLESFGNPRKFARVARRFARKKPILAVKSGRSAAGARATSSHTGRAAVSFGRDRRRAVSSGRRDPDRHHARAVRRRRAAGQAAGAARRPDRDRDQRRRPRDHLRRRLSGRRGPGPRVARARSAGSWPSCCPTAASLINPIDLIASASAEDFRLAVRTLAYADVCDAIITLFVPPLVTEATEVAAAISEAAQSAGDCCIAAVFMTGSGSPPELEAGPVKVPAFEFPEEAARAVALAARHGVWRTKPEGTVVRPTGCRPDEAAAVISHAMAEGSEWLSPDRVERAAALLRTSADRHRGRARRRPGGRRGHAAGRAAWHSRRWPPSLLHKSDAGGVRLGLDGPEAVRTAAAEIDAAVNAAGHELTGLVVQPMAPTGVELIVGVVHDLSFGPVLACGAGGTTAELIQDVQVRITPLTDLDAGEMLRSLQDVSAARRLPRGAEPCDIAAVEDVLLRVSAMVQAHPAIAELDCNPLIAGPSGATIVDARVRVAATDPAPPVPSLRAY